MFNVEFYANFRKQGFIGGVPSFFRLSYGRYSNITLLDPRVIVAFQLYENFISYYY